MILVEKEVENHFYWLIVFKLVVARELHDAMMTYPKKPKFKSSINCTPKRNDWSGHQKK